MFTKPYDYFNVYRDQIEKALAGIRRDPYESVFETLKTAGDIKRRVFVCGNGGSASISEHFSCDHSKGVHTDTKYLRPDIVSLSSNMATITAIGNDIGFDSIFSKQIEFANGYEEDILIAISASGNSPNIIRALETANEKRMLTIALVGFDGGRAKDLADIVVHVNSDNYGVVEDCHQIIMHSWAQALRIKGSIGELKL